MSIIRLLFLCVFLSFSISHTSTTIHRVTERHSNSWFHPSIPFTIFVFIIKQSHPSMLYICFLPYHDDKSTSASWLSKAQKPMFYKTEFCFFFNFLKMLFILPTSYKIFCLIAASRHCNHRCYSLLLRITQNIVKFDFNFLMCTIEYSL